MWELINRFKNSSLPAVIAERRSTSWETLCSLAARAAQDLESIANERVGIICDGSAECFAVMAALDFVKANAFLLDSGKTANEIDELADAFNLSAVITVNDGGWEITRRGSAPEKSEQACVTILTSGTTGKPKAARHTWTTLSRPVATLKRPIEQEKSDQSRWLLTFRPQLYAGLQVVLHAFADGGAIVVPDLGSERSEVVEIMRKHNVGFVSATPSFWRGILLSVEVSRLTDLPIKQITLGGELVDQGLLNSLVETFASARIVHIYATTELGKCFSVTDGLAGFPATYLDRDLPGDVKLKVDGGQLFVRSENRMREYDPLGSRLQSSDGAEDTDEWSYTGDLVEIRGDRVLFVGRDTDIINVGGYKVNPTKVENVIREIDSVANVRVFGKSSSVTGQIVACEIVLRDQADSAATLQAIRESAAAELDRYHIPRIVNVVDRIELTSAGKTRRSE